MHDGLDVNNVTLILIPGTLLKTIVQVFFWCIRVFVNFHLNMTVALRLPYMIFKNTVCTHDSEPYLGNILRKHLCSTLIIINNYC